jgi:hypothetical protein
MTTRPLRVSLIAVGNGLLGPVGMLWAVVAGIVALVTNFGPFEPRVLADACYPMAFGVLWAMLRFAAAAAQTTAGIGLYAMRPWSRSLAIGVACFWLFAFLMSAVAIPVSLLAIQFSSSHIWIVVAVALSAQLLLRGAWSAFTLWTLLDPEIIAAFEPVDEASEYAFRPLTAPQSTPLLVPLTPNEAATIAASTPPPVTNPWQFVVSGPNLPAWQPTGEGRRHREWKIAALIAIGMLGLLLIAGSTAFGLGGKIFFAFVTLAGGLFCLGSVWFERKRFFESRRARGMRWRLGEAGARKFYLGLGAALVLMSYAMSAAGIAGPLLFLAVMPTPDVMLGDLPGEFDFHLPPLANRMEGWKSTKAETAPLPAGAVIVQPEKAWRGSGSTRLAAIPDDGLLLFKDQQPPRHWRRGKEVGVALDPPEPGGTNVCHGVSAGGQHFLAMQQYWNEPRRVRRVIASASDLQQPKEQSWPNFDRPGRGWFVEHIKGAAVSDDGQTVVFADNHKNVFAWNTETQEPEKLPIQAADDARLALSPDGRWLLIGERSGQVRLVELAGTKPGYQAAVQGQTVQVAFAPNGQLFCSLHEHAGRNAVQVWQLDDTGVVQHRHNFGNYSSTPMAAFSPDSQRIALYGRQADMIQVRDLSSGQEIFRLTHRDGVQATAICFSADGSRVIADGAKLQQWVLPAVP